MKADDPHLSNPMKKQKGTPAGVPSGIPNSELIYALAFLF